MSIKVTLTNAFLYNVSGVLYCISKIKKISVSPGECIAIWFLFFFWKKAFSWMLNRTVHMWGTGVHQPCSLFAFAFIDFCPGLFALSPGEFELWQCDFEIKGGDTLAVVFLSCYKKHTQEQGPGLWSQGRCCAWDVPRAVLSSVCLRLC